MEVSVEGGALRTDSERKCIASACVCLCSCSNDPVAQWHSVEEDEDAVEAVVEERQAETDRALLTLASNGCVIRSRAMRGTATRQVRTSSFTLMIL